MENSTLKQLIIEYDIKRRKALSLADEKKKKIFSSFPELALIDKEISRVSIDASKEIILSDSIKKADIIKKMESTIKVLENKKYSLLDKLKIDKSLLEPIFECSICNDTGFVTKDGQTSICPCLKQKLYNIEYNKSNVGNLEKENFDNFDFNKYSDEVNFEKYNSDISPRENMVLIKNICEKFIANFDNPDEKNLLFTGNTGLGKTFLSSAIANEILKQGKTVLYQTSPVMLDSIIDYRFGKSNAGMDIIQNLLTVDLLIIDDLGTETMNQMKFTELFNIINSRLLNQNRKITKTIISTNLSLKNIFTVYEERLGSRFVGNYNICRFFGDDIRFMK